MRLRSSVPVPSSVTAVLVPSSVTAVLVLSSVTVCNGEKCIVTGSWRLIF